MSQHLGYSYAGRSVSGKTTIWSVLNVDQNVPLGRVMWYGPWRKYTFRPFQDTVFDDSCLAGIAEFCAEQTVAHYEALKQAKEES